LSSPDAGHRATASTLRLRGRASHLSVREEVAGTAHTLVLTGELDLASRPLLDEFIRSVVDHKATVVVLDIDGIEFIDSTGLHAIIAACRLCEQHGCAMELVGGGSQVLRLFELAGVLDELPLRSPAPAHAGS
jgi:anti-sigma B factor antagonist